MLPLDVLHAVRNLFYSTSIANNLNKTSVLFHPLIWDFLLLYKASKCVILLRIFSTTYHLIVRKGLALCNQNHGYS